MIAAELQRRAEDIFFELVEQGATPEAVAAACGGDAALRAEVESLLGHHRGEQEFLNTERLREAAIPGVRTPPAPLALHARVGGYTILGVLGTGGMGVVYVAQQERPRRTVALKLIRRELASAGMLRRFEHEAEVLGRLQHPGIAQIFEAGTADGEGGPGQPYIAMELVNGPPLTQHADQRRLSTRERLELFLGVCDAVQHAHQRGVIHRDLKPANILVEEKIQPPRPKVLDFGVARLADAEVGAVTQQTNMGQLIGTLAYMSPEQVVGDPAEIDTRADVYALGVVLYQLLSGRLPLELGSRSIPEAARVIRDDAPPRLGTINRGLRGDLETIVATALEKDKSRRYQSAAELADDIRRYLEGRPIAAKDASALDLLRRQIRRYRGTVAVGAVSIIALVAVAGYALRESWRNERLALSEAGAKSEALVALDAARRSRAAADDAARKLAAELAVSRVERGTLLGRAGNLLGAEDLIWPEHLKDPGSRQTYWALWELYSRQPCLASIRAHEGAVRGVAFTPDGSTVVSSGDDGVVRFWDLRALREVRAIPGGVGKATDVALSADGRLAAWCGSEGQVRVWDIAAGGAVWTVAGHTGNVHGVAFSADGRRVVSCGEDRAVRVWDAATGAAVSAMTEHTGAVLRAVFSPDGRWVASGSVDSTIRLWDGTAGSAAQRVLRGHRQGITVLDFSPDGAVLGSGAGDRLIMLWDVATGERTATLTASNGPIRPLVFGPRGETLFTGGWWTADTWDVAAGKRTRARSLPESANCGAASRDGRLAAVGAGSGEMRVWELDAGGAVSMLPAHSGRTNVALSPDERLIATGDGTGLVRLWEAPAEGRPVRLLAEWPGHPMGVRSLEFSPDGKYLATAAEGGTARLWDLATGKAAGLVDSGVDAVSSRAVSFSPDGTLLVLPRTDTSVTLHRVPDLEVVRTYPRVSQQVVSAVFSPSGAWVACSSRDRAVRLWPVRGSGPAEATVLMSTGAMPWTIGFSADGARLLTGDWGKGVQVWDLKERKPVSRLDGHSGLVTTVDFVPHEPEMAITASADGTVRLWDVGSGRSLLTLEAFAGWDAVSLAIGADARTLVASSLNGEVAVWDLRYYSRHIIGNLEAQLARRGEVLAEAGRSAGELRAWGRQMLEGLASRRPGPAGVDPETIAGWGKAGRGS